MGIKVGISGFGRIGRLVLRASVTRPNIEIAGINYRSADDLNYLVYMLKYDSTFGRFPGELGTYENGITINGKKIPVYKETELDAIPNDNDSSTQVGDVEVVDCFAPHRYVNIF